MNCEEFEIVGLDFERDSSLNDDCRLRASQHARLCGKCAALKSSWLAAQTELAALGEGTRNLGVPSRIESCLLQQFRLKHQSQRDHRILKFGMWALAAAAVLVFTISVWSWHKWRQGPTGNMPAAGNSPVAETIKPSVAIPDSGGSAIDGSSETLLASNDDGDFTQLLGSTFQETEDGAIVRLGMQRASLAAFGLPVNEERAGDWIELDVLVAGDGSPQAVRLPQ
jgi:hypothetical protein